LPLGLAALAVLGILGGLVADSAAQGMGPTLRVTVNGLTEYVFTPGSSPAKLTVLSSLPATIRWEAIASQPGTTIDGTRHGWNIRDLDNDQEWSQTWCSNCPAVTTRVLPAGTERFFLQVRDSAGRTTLARFEFNAIPLGIESVSWTDVRIVFSR
jgi:hypothetical protein